MIDGSFSHNVKEFVTRFNGRPSLSTTDFYRFICFQSNVLFLGKTEYIRNLFFVFLIELRALHKSEPYLLNKVNWQSSGDQSLTKEAIKDLLRTVRY